MSKILKIWLFSGKICAEVKSKTILPKRLRLSVFVNDVLTHEQSFFTPSSLMRGDGRQVFNLPLPVRKMFESNQSACEVKLTGFRLSERRSLKLRDCNRKERPIVVSDKKPNGARLSGWIVPKDATNPRMTFYVDGKLTGSHAPTRNRRDIVKLYPETANIMNGFGFTIPEYCYDGKPHDFLVIEETSGVIAENGTMTATPEILRDALIRRSTKLISDMKTPIEESLR